MATAPVLHPLLRGFHWRLACATHGATHWHQARQTAAVAFNGAGSWRWLALACAEAGIPLGGPQGSAHPLQALKERLRQVGSGGQAREHGCWQLLRISHLAQQPCKSKGQ